MVAGPGWGRVGSWEGLEEAVAVAGASAVVLVSFAGDRVGHAVVLYRASEGLRWVDPAGGVVSRDRPEALRRAVAGWAVVVGGDGRVAGVPGDWSAPASAGQVAALVDAPVRHDFGAMGAEIEWYNIRLLRRPGQLLPAGEWLVRSQDGLVRIVADNRTMWVNERNVVFESEAAMRATGVSSGDGAGDRPEELSVTKIVLDRLDRPGRSETRSRIHDLLARFDRAPLSRDYVHNLGRTLAEMFEGSGYQVNQDFRDTRVVGLPGIFGDAPMYVRPSVGVPLGGGVLAVLQELPRRTNPATLANQVSKAALHVGWSVARRYLDATARAALGSENFRTLAPGWDVAHVVMITEYMALASAQVTGALLAQRRPGLQIREFLPVVARQDLAEIRMELPGGAAVPGRQRRTHP